MTTAEPPALRGLVLSQRDKTHHLVPATFNRTHSAHSPCSTAPAVFPCRTHACLASTYFMKQELKELRKEFAALKKEMNLLKSLLNLPVERPLHRRDELHLVCRSLTVQNHKRHPGVWISSEAGGPEILLYGPDRKPRVLLEATNQRGAMNILGSDGEHRAQLFTHEEHGNVEGYMEGLEDDRSYVVQATSNLVNWVNIATNAPVDSFLDFMDLDAHLFPHRFYRALPMGGVLGSVASLDGMQFTYRLLGVTGRSYVIQASTNMQTWTDLTTNVAADGSVVLTNVLDAAFPYRFFRLKSGP